RKSRTAGRSEVGQGRAWHRFARHASCTLNRCRKCCAAERLRCGEIKLCGLELLFDGTIGRMPTRRRKCGRSHDRGRDERSVASRSHPLYSRWHAQLPRAPCRAARLRLVTNEGRWYGEKTQPLPLVAGELVRAKVDVIVAGTAPAPEGAQRATSTIP